jgi:hypothetical protein
MKTLLLIILILNFSCSSNEKRTKFSDKNMRIAIDSAGIKASDYVGIQTAIVKEDAFAVIDRGQGFSAIKTEQERLHRNQSDRFLDKEKWAQWGKMLGVGAVVVGHSQCYRAKKFFSIDMYVNRCKQYINLVDANTGSVIVAVENEDDQSIEVDAGSFQKPQDWSVIVRKLVDAYPKDYKPVQYSDGLMNYQDVSQEEAIRQKELVEKQKGK